jgi:hypothetical protein
MIARRVGFVPSRSGVSTRIIKSSGGSSGCGRVERTLRLTTIYVCLFSPHIPRRSGPTDSTNCNGTLNSGLRRGPGITQVCSFGSGENHDTGVRGRWVTELKVDKLAPQCSCLFGETDNDASPWELTPSHIALERPCTIGGFGNPRTFQMS